VRVPLLDLRAQFAPIRDEVLTAIASVCDDQRFIMGPEVEGLESMMAPLTGSRHAIGVSSEHAIVPTTRRLFDRDDVPRDAPDE